MNYKFNLFLFILQVLLLSCNSNPGTRLSNGRLPAIYPDYSGITIPVNIAPINFLIEEDGESYIVEVHGENGSILSRSSRTGIIRFPENKWKNFLEQNQNSRLEYHVFVKDKGEWQKFDPFVQTVTSDKIDPFLYYRLLHPGYESWTEISIVRRNLESFKEKTVVANNVLDQNCVNCHTFNKYNQSDFMFHVRGNNGGTYFLEGDNLKKVNLKTDKVPNGAVYPSWHPTGRFIAFSSNKVIQQFHAGGSKKIEVSDLESQLVLYDYERNEILDVDSENRGNFMDTYPEWTPCGNYLYFCRAEQPGKNIDFSNIRYDLYRIAFQANTRTFSNPEPVFKASENGKSVSFPKVSPDGKRLVFTMHDYGCFPIWHQEADLYSIDPGIAVAEKLPVNSEFTESYHSWSANGRWLIFSSKRGDGLSARPYMAWFGENGTVGKPFVLPQKDPMFYDGYLKTYNLPEFAESEVSFSPRQLRNAAKARSIMPQWIKSN
jgi:hypothetical protein